MKNFKPIVLLSFLFFTSVISDDFSQPLVDSNEVADFDDSEDFDFDNIDDFDNDENEDIVYTGMVSTNPKTTPNSPKAPVVAPVVTCKKWRCSMNGYIPNWKPNVPSLCTKDYVKLSINYKAYCQDNFCEKVCEKF